MGATTFERHAPLCSLRAFARPLVQSPGLCARTLSDPRVRVKPKSSNATRSQSTINPAEAGQDAILQASGTPTVLAEAIEM
jgi:hypothetical protein